jgi:hypothetical protein
MRLDFALNMYRVLRHNSRLQLTAEIGKLAPVQLRTSYVYADTVPSRHHMLSTI